VNLLVCYINLDILCVVYEVSIWHSNKQQVRPYWCDTPELMRSIQTVGLIKGQAENVHYQSSH